MVNLALIEQKHRVFFESESFTLVIVTSESSSQNIPLVS